MAYHLTRGNLSCWQIKVICFYILIWIDLTTFPTSDSKLEITFAIAHSLSYNILNLGRKWSYNNLDTAQRSLPCRFMFGKKWPPIDITRKYDKLCIVAFNRKFDYDDVTKWQINVIYLVENCLSYNISKFGRKPMTGKWDNLNWTKDVWRHQWKFWRARTCAS